MVAVPVGAAVETLRPLPTDPLADVPRFVVGVAVVRGAPLPVIDVGILLAGEAEAAGRWLVCRVGARRVALALSSVVGVRSVPADALHDLPPLLGEAASAAAGALAALDSELAVVLDAARCVPEAAWHHLERA